MAIGTYSATPLDMAGAYTTFANNGVHLKPWVLASVRNPQGDIVADFAPEAKQVLDPRVAYLTQSLMEGVMNHGTAAIVRLHGFTAPAAGKTGTSHDAWFAGYSSNLLCIIWVGNDDYTNVNLEGAKAAAPIWAEFMNRAIRLPQYSDMKSFTAPEGVQVMRINRATNMPIDESCSSDSYEAAFLVGTAPQGTCSRMGEDTQALGDRLMNGGNTNSGAIGVQPGSPMNPSNPNSYPATPNRGNQPVPAPLNNQPAPAEPEKHRNAFQKLFGLGKDKDKQPPPQPQ
jgi:penicillin-binding protein 1B